MSVAYFTYAYFIEYLTPSTQHSTEVFIDCIQQIDKSILTVALTANVLALISHSRFLIHTAIILYVIVILAHFQAAPIY